MFSINKYTFLVIVTCMFITRIRLCITYVTSNTFPADTLLQYVYYIITTMNHVHSKYYKGTCNNTTLQYGINTR